MELFNLYLWIQVVYGFIGILVLLVLLYAILSVVFLLKRAIRRANLLFDDTQEKISSVMDKLWFLKLFTPGE